ncbi:MAG: protein-export chaperone SecB [Salinisphaeraceae bacterium]|nr:protein-export chaperone SecB [Salinisphaeraceae bacterium]
MTDEAQAGGKQVAIQKIYVKDASLEVPNAPAIFTQEWKPQMDVQLNTGVQDLSDEAHEVVLTVTVTAKLDDQTAYLAEVKQAGVFLVRGFEDEAERRAILGAYCPNTMFPFVRETVADLVVRAGFPHFLLQPVNFDALYQQHLQQQQNKAETKH